MRHLKSALVLLGVTALSTYFLALAYHRASHDAILQLYAQERILAEQAAQGITTYFSYNRQMLEFLAQDPDVAANTPRGQRLLRDVFVSGSDNLLSITRMAADGRILYSYPSEEATGQSILHQPHVQAFLERRRPVVSRVFTSVQGFETVALHVPVYDGERFAGSLAALIPFDIISRRYLAGIRIGETGHALLLSREGIELFCPVPGHTGRPVDDTSAAYPMVRAMAARMLRGESGTAIYEYHGVGPAAGTIVEKHAYFMKIPLEDSFWTIAVTAPEAEALAFIQGFRDWWVVAMALMVGAFIVWGVFLAQAYLRLGREEARKLAQDRVLAAEREREQALRESEERFRTYFEESRLPMAITSPERKWLVVNERLAELLGRSREELRGVDWAQHTHPDDLPAEEREFARMLAGEIDGYSIEKRFVRAGGSIVHAILSVRLVRRPDGSPDHCLAQVQDISDRKRLDEERARLEEQLRQAQKLEAIGRLAGGVAHDYNNLLTVQFGHLAMLREEPALPPGALAPIAEIEKSARMAAQLTRQLLAFGRRQVLQFQRLDLNEAVGSVATLLGRVLPETIALDVRTAPEPLWVDADAGTIEQVIVNLVVNARDAMPEGGRVTLATQRVTIEAGHEPPHADAQPGVFACLSVADTGTGMDAETRRRIFEPFFTTKDASRGLGLGLATIYGIVRQHGGWIDVESEPGRGARFRVYYVAAAPAEQANPPSPVEAHPVVSGGGTVLLVEDNDAVRTTLTRTLERLGFRVLVSTGPSGARRLWAAHRDEVSLLVSDMMMLEGESGLELASALRRERPGLPVIIMSGYSQDLAGHSLEAGMVFLAKPWTRPALARALDDSLRKARAADVPAP